MAKLSVVSTSSVNGVNNCTLRSSDNTTSSFYIGHGPSGVVNIASDSNIGFGHTNNTTYTERMRLDATSGRLLIGTPSTSSTALLQVQGNSGDSAGGAILQLRRGINNASIINNSALGSIEFGNTESTISAVIAAEADANWNTTNDYPSRLVFSTTADAAGTPTERLRINNSGAFGFAGTNFGTAGQVLVSNGASAAPSWGALPATTQPNATETVKGIIQLATAAEVLAGTDAVKAVTPKEAKDHYLAKNIALLTALP